MRRHLQACSIVHKCATCGVLLDPRTAYVCACGSTGRNSLTMVESASDDAPCTGARSQNSWAFDMTQEPAEA
jgi:recombinational DNA repair protein RecR